MPPPFYFAIVAIRGGAMLMARVDGVMLGIICRIFTRQARLRREIEQKLP